MINGPLSEHKPRDCDSDSAVGGNSGESRTCFNKPQMSAVVALDPEESTRYCPSIRGYFFLKSWLVGYRETG